MATGMSEGQEASARDADRLRVYAYRPDPEPLELPLTAMRELLAIWHQLRDASGCGLPARTQLDALDLGPYASSLMVIEAESGGQDFRYLHHGSEMSLHFGRDMTGARLSDLPRPTASYYFDLIAQLEQLRVPVYSQAEAAGMVAVDYWDRLLLPFASDGAKVDSVVLYNVARAWRVSPERYLQLAQYLNYMRQGLCVIDENGLVLKYNQALLEMFQADISSLEDKMPLAAFQQALGVPMALPLEPASGDGAGHPSAAAGQPVSAATQIQEVAPGKSLSLSAVRLPQGGVAVVVTDITTEVAVRAELQQAKENLEAMVRERTEQLEGTVRELERRSAEQARLEVQLAQEKARLETTLLAMTDGVIRVTNDGTVALMNRAAESMTGWSQAAALGKPIGEVLKLEDERSGKAAESLITRAIRERRPLSEAPHFVLISKTGRRINISQRAAPIQSGEWGRDGAVLVFSDATEAYREEQRIRHDATHDSLTGLANRSEAMSRMEAAIADHRRYGTSYALLFMDLDGFKLINDANGHAAGDEFLQEIASRLRTRARQNDLVARFGGDEFMMLLERCTPPNAVQVAEDVRGLIAAHAVELGDREKLQHGSASIGVTMIDSPETTLADHLNRADLAAYAAKQAGGNRVFVWDEATGNAQPTAPETK